MWRFLICCLVQNASFVPDNVWYATADIVCCVTQQTCLLGDTADTSAV